MDLSPRMTKTVNGAYEVRTGQIVPWRPGGIGLTFDVDVECLSASPERWQGRVRFAGTVLIRTEPMPEWDQAARLAQKALEQRVVEIFSRI